MLHLLCVLRLLLAMGENLWNSLQCSCCRIATHVPALHAAPAVWTLQAMGENLHDDVEGETDDAKTRCARPPCCHAFQPAVQLVGGGRWQLFTFALRCCHCRQRQGAACLGAKRGNVQHNPSSTDCQAACPALITSCRRLKLIQAVEGDNWSAVVGEQTDETLPADGGAPAAGQAEGEAGGQPVVRAAPAALCMLRARARRSA